MLFRNGCLEGYKSNGKETEKALLRFIINHIVDIVDEEAEIISRRNVHCPST
jgi:hypothetical protein